MSLFGDDEPSNSAMEQSQSKSIFGETSSTAVTTQSNSLFQDDNNNDAAESSPWGFPTPKKASRADQVKNLLPARDAPEAYVDVFDKICGAGYRDGLSMSAEGVQTILKSSGLGAAQQSQILRQVTGGATMAPSLGRDEVNVLLALIGLAQEGEDATLDSVDERRKRLPTPSITGLEQLKANTERRGSSATAETERPVPKPESPSQNRRREDSLIESDPWGSPDMHKNHAHTQAAGSGDQSSYRDSLQGAPRTTSGMTNYSDLPTTPAPEPATGGWGEPASQATGFGGEPDALANGFGTDTTRQRPTSRALGGGNRVSRSGPEETIAITLLPEKEGLFMFQHRNYEVKSNRRGSTVVRRYSDFVWLLDCLHKRYPFRQLPLLPPKRVAVNGRHLSNDPSFLDKRRRGLVRFVNALVRHPVLSQEQLVVMFLTVPTELAVWRKQATISVQEEFTDRQLPPGLEDSLAPSLLETFDTIREGVRASAEHYINLVNLLDRLTKRNQGVAADSLRFSQALGYVMEESGRTYAFDTNDVPLLNEGIKATARHLSQHQQLLEDEARAWDLGVLEDLKRQRDGLVSVRDMFDRRDRLSKDNIPQLEKRIETNEQKLANLRLKPAETVKPGEVEKVEQAILNDKQSIVNQHARGVFIKECVRDELLFFQQTQYHVGRLHQDWAQERVKYAELVADNWRGLADQVDQMPTGER